MTTTSHTLKTSLLVSFLFFVFALIAPGCSLAAENAQSQFVSKLGDTALMSLTGKNVNRATRESRVRTILHSNFDVQAIGKFAMGPYWKDMTDAQRKEYLDLFEDMIVQTYTTRFEEYSGQMLKVGTSTPAGKDYIVQSQVVQKDGPPVNLQWRLRDTTSGLRVIDVVVEGVSMSVTQRSDFSAVIQRGGGSVDALLASLRERHKMVSSQKG